jgi:hypothetical protein
VQVQIAFFLKHWAEIKKSETMKQIFQQIRLGKHVGFEDGESARSNGSTTLIGSIQCGPLSWDSWNSSHREAWLIAPDEAMEDRTK